MSDTIQVEVVFPLPDEQVIKSLSLPLGTTIEQAIQASDLQQRYPQIDLEKQKVGIFGKLSKLDSPLRDRDRVEIYRPLIADPKEVRKQRAAEGKVMKKGAGDNEAE